MGNRNKSFYPYFGGDVKCCSCLRSRPRNVFILRNGLEKYFGLNSYCGECRAARELELKHLQSISDFLFECQQRQLIARDKAELSHRLSVDLLNCPPV